MRYGFTTGSCAAAAAKAAAYMLLSGKVKKNIEIETPAGKMFDAEIVDIRIDEMSASCAVIKDGGDDPDITTGAHICAYVEAIHNFEDRIDIEGGNGVGTVTRPGLDQPVGNAAINSIPRQMILKEVYEVKQLLDFHHTLKVIISVPEGTEIAKKTFNPRLGIENGISILGTSGIVEPMSSQALIETIRTELNQKWAMGMKEVCISPGNYGLDFMKNSFSYDLEKAVKCSNFIGITIDMAKEIGFTHVLLVGHLGKLVKVAGGIMNTHSKEADCRMELLAGAVIRACRDEFYNGGNAENVYSRLLLDILECVNTEEAFNLIINAGIEKEVGQVLSDSVEEKLNRRAVGEMRVECMVYTNEHGLIGQTKGALKLMDKIKESE